MKFCILGAGKWGLAIGRLLEQNKHEVIYRHHGESEWPSPIDFLCIALPVQHLNESLIRFAPPGVPILSLSKGLEIGTGRRVSEIIAQAWGPSSIAALSGPNFAAEIIQGLPAAAVVASENSGLVEAFQKALHQPTFRLYGSMDLAGVELGGALKNIYAIAAGICVGLNLGQNAFAALLTRCLAEMTRLGVSLGGREETFAGLSGVGDLWLTSGSDQSRNFRVGHRLSQGISLEKILAELGGVAEGVPTTRSIYERSSIPADWKPVAAQVHAILYQGIAPRDAVEQLLGRAPSLERR